MDLVNIILGISLLLNATCTLILYFKYCKLKELVDVLGKYTACRLLDEKLEELKNGKKSN